MICEMKSSQQRLLFIVYELPPIGGGVATAAAALLKELSLTKAFEIDVVTASPTLSFSVQELYPGVRVFRIPVGKWKKQQLKQQTPLEMLLFTSISFFLCFFLQLKNNYSLAHYFGYPGALNGWLLRWQNPYIVSLRGVDVPGYNKAYGTYYKVYRWLSKITWSAAAGVTVNSEWLLELARKTSPSTEFELIPNGVDVKTFKPVASSKKHTLFGVTAGGTLMNSKKQLDVLIRGFYLFHLVVPESQLILFGDGPLRQNLKRLVQSLNIAESVLFSGVVSKDQLATELPKCHVCVHPSSAEGMSNAVLEAAACGLHLVVSDVSAGVAEDAVVLQQVTPFEIAKELCRVYVLPERQIVRNLATWQVIAHKYRELYDRSQR